MISEIITLDQDNRYQIWERLDHRQKSTWDCAELGQGFFGTSDQLLKYLKKKGIKPIGKCQRARLRVETAPNEEGDEARKASEKQAEEVARIKAKALAKLSKEEKAVLGFK